MADAAAHTADSTAAEVSARMPDSNADQHVTAANTAPKAAAVATQTKAAKGSRRVSFPDSALMGAAAAPAPIEGMASEYVQIVQEEDGETYAALSAADQHATAADTAPKAAAVATQTKAGKGSRRILSSDPVPMGAVAVSAPIEGTASEYVRIVQGEDGWHG